MNNKEFKIFLFGSYKNNTGPDNVNRNLINNYQHTIFYEKITNPILKRIERLFYILKCDVVVFSGLCNITFWLNLSKFLKKKTVYLMHGYVSYEKEINKLELNNNIENIEKEYFKKVDLILPVSEKYKNWIVKKVPEIKEKTYFLNLGIEANITTDYKNFKNSKSKEKIVIVVAGGDRIQKNNIDVCVAVELLSKRIEQEIELQIYGRKYLNVDTFSQYPHTTYCGMVSQEIFYERLKNSNIFILNSEVESFGLSVVNALLCGCNVLISENSGILSVIDLEENDIIHNTHNPKEIADKLEAVLKNENFERILSKIDFEHYSWQNVSERLYKICYALYKGTDYSSIR